MLNFRALAHLSKYGPFCVGQSLRRLCAPFLFCGRSNPHVELKIGDSSVDLSGYNIENQHKHCILPVNKVMKQIAEHGVRLCFPRLAGEA